MRCRHLRALVGLALAQGCTVQAPPAEDFSGEGVVVEEGRVKIDDSRVPVVDECASGQVVARSDDGWRCIEPQAGSGAVLAGDGLTASQDEAGLTLSVDDTQVPLVDLCTSGQLVARTDSGWTCVAPLIGGGTVLAGSGLSANGDEDAVTLSVDFGSGAGQVASGEALSSVQATAVDAQARVATLEADATALEGRATALEADVTAVEGRATALEADVTAVEGRATALETELETRQLAHYFIGACDPAAAGGLRFDAQSGTLQLCDGGAFRSLALASAAAPATLYHRLMTPRWIEGNATVGALRAVAFTDESIAVGTDTVNRRARVVTVPLFGPGQLDPSRPVLVTIVVNKQEPTADNDPTFGLADGFFGDETGARTFLGVELRDAGNADLGYFVSFAEGEAGPGGNTDSFPGSEVLAGFGGGGLAASSAEILLRLEPPTVPGGDASVICTLRVGLASRLRHRLIPFSLEDGLSFSVYANDTTSETYTFFSFEVTAEYEG